MPSIPTWDQPDAVGLRTYLETSSGRNFLSYLKAVRPPLAGKTTDETVRNAQRAEGWEELLNVIDAMASYEPAARRPRPFISIQTESMTRRGEDERPPA